MIAQSALPITSLADLFNQTPFQLLWEASSHMQQLMREGCLHTYPSLVYSQVRIYTAKWTVAMDRIRTRVLLVDNPTLYPWATALQNPKCSILGLILSIVLLMTYFTFWISPLSATILIITPCLMVTQTLTMSFNTLLRACTSTLQWFKINQMKANPTKMQAISYDKRGTREIIDVTFENTTIHFDNSVVLLGIEIDHSQTFNKHFTNMCKTTARQLAIFKRISHIFTRHGKIFKLFTAITQPRTTSC